MSIKKSILSSVFALVAFQFSFAQEAPNSNTYRFALPFLGDKAVERGADLPLPIGISVSYYSQDMDININSIAVGSNPAEMIEYGPDNLVINESSASAQSITVRPDVWVLPFLNVYGIFGKSWVKTNVDALFGAPTPTNPIMTNVSPEGSVLGFGAMASYKVGPVWANVDFNTSWNALDILDTPARANNVSIRVGHRFNINRKHALNAWVGASYQSFESKNTGNIAVSEAVKEVPEGSKESAAYLILARFNGINVNVDPQTGVPFDTTPDNDIDDVRLFQEMVGGYMQQGKSPLEDNIAYSIQKSLERPWMMTVGAQYEFNKRIQWRSEVGFLGDRTMFMSSIGYRFGF